jgi:hypothetical protein
MEFSTTKMQSKISEDVVTNFQIESMRNKLIPPSPVIKLNKKTPSKQISKASKASKASKTSSKKSGAKKNAKRQPRKYAQPNLSKEKLSTKSLVTSTRYIGDEPLISDTKVEEKVGMGPNKSVIKSLKDDDNNSKKKYAPRFTIGNATAEGMDFKQGVIVEDQHESSDNSSDETSRDKNSMSSLKSDQSISSMRSSDPDHEMLTMNFGKSNSLQVSMKKNF